MCERQEERGTNDLRESDVKPEEGAKKRRRQRFFFFFGFVSPFNDCSSVKPQGSIGGPFIDVNEHALQGTLPLNSEG